LITPPRLTRPRANGRGRLEAGTPPLSSGSVRRLGWLSLNQPAKMSIQVGHQGTPSTKPVSRLNLLSLILRQTGGGPAVRARGKRSRISICCSAAEKWRETKTGIIDPYPPPGSLLHYLYTHRHLHPLGPDPVTRHANQNQRNERTAAGPSSICTRRHGGARVCGWPSPKQRSRSSLWTRLISTGRPSLRCSGARVGVYARVSDVQFGMCFLISFNQTYLFYFYFCG
jgi:hypothetical protein